MFQWKLDRPLAVLDIEATGTSPRADRIVELAVITLMPDGSRRTRVWRVNPQMPIPAEATDIHGITDEDVAACPTFQDLAADIAAELEGCDLGGYNVLRFDLPMLAEEFQRAGMTFDPCAHRVLDAQRVFHKREPRDLEAALQFYCGEPHQDAHGAEADARATVRVMEGQFERYPDLPRDIGELAEYCSPKDPTWVDSTGRLKWRNREVVLNFGRRKGTPLKVIVEGDPNFVKWMLRSDFPMDTRRIVEQALDGKYPSPAGADPRPEDRADERQESP